MSDREKKNLGVVRLPAAVSRLMGAYLGVLALWVSWLASALAGVQQTTALFRGVMAGLGFALLGRVAGYVIGRYLAKIFAQDRPAPDVEPVA